MVAEIIAEIIPIMIPSTIKGIRTNQSVAPTDFIMLISKRRLYIVSLMVLDRIKSDTRPNTTTMKTPLIDTSLSNFVNFSKSSLRFTTLSTPSIFLINGIVIFRNVAQSDVKSMRKWIIIFNSVKN